MPTESVCRGLPFWGAYLFVWGIMFLRGHPLQRKLGLLLIYIDTRLEDTEGTFVNHIFS